jgi:hypothetical protein
MKSRDILDEVSRLTLRLVELGLSVAQNFPCILRDGNREIVTWCGQQDISIALKNLRYKDIYDELDLRKNFNIKMIDGALVHIMYIFNRRELLAHRLAFFPSPNLDRYDDRPTDYDEYYDQDIYADIIAEKVVTFPLRFEYGNDPEKIVDMDHPYSHLTLGQYKNCRIPVCSPITPNLFLHFLLKNFYFTAFKRDFANFDLPFFKPMETITNNEKTLLHMNFTRG